MTVAVTWPQVLAWRLRRQFVESTERADPIAVARRLCGVQAQVASSADLAMAVRTGRRDPEEIRRALWRDRTLIKMWLVRGTLHLIPADELPAYCATLGASHFWEKPSFQRGHGVTAAEIEAILDAVPRALGSPFASPGERPAAAPATLTREELVGAVLEITGDAHLRDALSSGWGMLLKPLSMLGKIVYGPPREGKVTFTSPGLGPLPSMEEAGVRVLRAFLGAHGPATPEMFDKWLFRGATRKAALRGWFRDLRAELAEVEVDGRVMPVLAEHLDDLAATRPSESAHLLGGFDQYILGAPRDLEPLLPKAARPKVSRTAGWISPVVVYQGRVVGVWEARDGRPVLDLFEPVPGPILDSAVSAITPHLAR